MASTHAAIVVGDGHQIIHVGPSLGVAHKLRHVQVPEKKTNGTLDSADHQRGLDTE